jgi:predicted PurR-regulated permease PerM
VTEPTDHPEHAAVADATQELVDAVEASPDIELSAADRRRVREVLGGLVTRVTAERALRGAEAAEVSSRRAAEVATTAAGGAGRGRQPLQPFRTGFFGGLGLLVAYVCFLLVDSIKSTIILLVVATILAIGLDPAVRFLQRRHLRRGWSVLIVFVALMLSLGGIFYAIIPPIVTEVSKLVQSAPEYLANLQNNPTIRGLDEKFQLIEKIENSEFIKNIGTGAFTVTFTVAGIFIDLLIVLILTLYFLGGLPRITATAYRLAPATRRARVTDLGNKIITQLGGYLSGATIIALQAGFVAGIFAWIVGLPYPWAIALGAAALDYIPVIGPIIIGAAMMLLGFTQSVTIGLVAVGFYICQHLFEAYWLYPRVMRRTVDISAGAVVVAIIIGGALLGVMGALLAVPVAAAVQLIVREVVLPMQERS